MAERSPRFWHSIKESIAFLKWTPRSSLRVSVAGVALCCVIHPALAQSGSTPFSKSPARLGLPQMSAQPATPQEFRSLQDFGSLGPPAKLLTPSIVVVQAEKKPEPKASEKKGTAPEGKEAAIRVSTQPPSQEELFRLDTELQLRDRILREAQQAGVKLELTEFGGAVRQPMPLDRNFPEQYSTYLPSTLCYGRLFFEQRSSERYGRDVWGVQPALGVGRFYFDLALWPLRLATWPLRPMDCNDDAGFLWERVAAPRHPWWLW